MGPFRMRALGPRDEDVEDEMDSCFRRAVTAVAVIFVNGKLRLLGQIRMWSFGRSPRAAVPMGGPSRLGWVGSRGL
jgi:hypothetical protein